MSFEYKKSLGQNFLKDKNIINNILNAINPNKNDLIIEIGPGSGALTKELVKKNCDVICFEIDERLKEKLKEIDNGNLKVYFKDFLKINFKDYDFSKYDNIIFVGNLPYYITTAIINKITMETNSSEIIIMIQKEVAERFMANSKTKQYNSLTVFLKYHYLIEKICDVSRNCFEPRPKVDSMVIRLLRTDKYKKIVKNEDVFYKLVKKSFKQKRKTLKNNLSGYNLEIINDALKKYNKSTNNRAEELNIEEFIDISNKIVS